MSNFVASPSAIGVPNTDVGGRPGRTRQRLLHLQSRRERVGMRRRGVSGKIRVEVLEGAGRVWPRIGLALAVPTSGLR